MTMAKPPFIVMWVFDGNQLVMGIAYTTMLKVKTCFKQMKDHLSFGMGEEMATCLEMNFTSRLDLIVIDL
jgi:hypothetical protein